MKGNLVGEKLTGTVTSLREALLTTILIVYNMLKKNKTIDSLVERRGRPGPGRHLCS